MVNLTLINTGKLDALLADLAVSLGLSIHSLTMDSSLVPVINDKVTIIA